MATKKAIKIPEERTEAVKRKPKHTQVAVWPGTILQPDELPDLIKFFKNEFKTRVQYLETVMTGPDMEDGHPVAGTGGRRDVLIAVHEDDIGHFAVPRMKVGIRWIEDVLGNERLRGDFSIYPAHVKQYGSWDFGITREEAPTLKQKLIERGQFPHNH